MPQPLLEYFLSQYFTQDLVATGFATITSASIGIVSITQYGIVTATSASGVVTYYGKYYILIMFLDNSKQVLIFAMCFKKFQPVKIMVSSFKFTLKSSLVLYL